jgi:hypothetical protein
MIEGAYKQLKQFEYQHQDQLRREREEKTQSQGEVKKNGCVNRRRNIKIV